MTYAALWRVVSAFHRDLERQDAVRIRLEHLLTHADARALHVLHLALHNCTARLHALAPLAHHAAAARRPGPHHLPPRILYLLAAKLALLRYHLCALSREDRALHSHCERAAPPASPTTLPIASSESLEFCSHSPFTRRTSCSTHRVSSDNAFSAQRDEQRAARRSQRAGMDGRAARELPCGGRHGGRGARGVRGGVLL